MVPTNSNTKLQEGWNNATINRLSLPNLRAPAAAKSLVTPMLLAWYFISKVIRDKQLHQSGGGAPESNRADAKAFRSCQLSADTMLNQYSSHCPSKKLILVSWKMSPFCWKFHFIMKSWACNTNKQRSGDHQKKKKKDIFTSTLKENFFSQEHILRKHRFVSQFGDADFLHLISFLQASNELSPKVIPILFHISDPSVDSFVSDNILGEKDLLSWFVLP